MTFIELFASKGALNEDQRRHLSERLVTELMSADGAPAEMRGEVITRITRVLAEIDENPQRLYQEPHAWVQIVELPNGNIGAFGQIMRLADIVKLVVDPGHKVTQASTSTAETAVETAIDPICGMTVVLDENAITVAHNGVTYAFCHITCRDIFVEQQGAATSIRREQ